MSFKMFYTRGKAADGLKSFLKSDISKKVKDQELAARLTPDYDVGCKRPTFSDDYLTTFNKEFQTSIVFMIECQVEYVIGGITKMSTFGAKSLSVKSSALQKYKEQRRGNDEKSTFAQGSCTSYYVQEQGRAELGCLDRTDVSVLVADQDL